MRFLTLLLLVGGFSGAAHAADADVAFNRIVARKTIYCGYFTWPPYITKDPNTSQLSGINYDAEVEPHVPMI